MRRGLSIKLWLVSRAVQYSSASMQQCTVGPSPAGTASGLSACCRSSCAHLHRQLRPAAACVHTIHGHHVRIQLCLETTSQGGRGWGQGGEQKQGVAGAMCINLEVI